MIHSKIIYLLLIILPFVISCRDNTEIGINPEERIIEIDQSNISKDIDLCKIAEKDAEFCRKKNLKIILGHSGLIQSIPEIGKVPDDYKVIYVTTTNSTRSGDLFKYISCFNKNSIKYTLPDK